MRNLILIVLAFGFAFLAELPAQGQFTSTASIEVRLNLAPSTFGPPHVSGPNRAIYVASVDCDVSCQSGFPEPYCQIDPYGINGHDLVVGAYTGGTDASDSSGDFCIDADRTDSLSLDSRVFTLAGIFAPPNDEVRCAVSLGNWDCVGEGCACPPSSGNAACDILSIAYVGYRFTAFPFNGSHTLDACVSPPANVTPGVKSLLRHRGVFALYVPPPTRVTGRPVVAAADYGTIGGFAPSAGCAGGEGGYSAVLTTVDGSQEFRVIAFDYSERQLDADGSGDFGVDDYLILPTLVGATQRNVLKLFDYTHNPNDPDNNVIEQAEIDTFRVLMRELLIGYSQPGLYGDLNGDGMVNCLDLDEIAAHVGASFGDSNYLAEFDFNLDGSISQTEKGRLFDRVVPGDATWDKAVNFADITYILTNWNASVAPYTGGDVTGDGAVNATDWTKILTNWGNTCN